MSEENLKTLSRNYKRNLKFFKEQLGVEPSYDVISHEMLIGGKQAVLFFIQGFVDNEVLSHIIANLGRLEREEVVPNTLEKLKKQHLSYMQLDTAEKTEKLIDAVLMGMCVLLVEGETEGIIIDLRNYAARMPEEPDLEKVVRGSRDGFTETIVINTQLIRRRIRDRSLRMEVMQVGRRSKSDVCISYLADVANLHLVEEIKKRLRSIDIDGLPMAEKSVEELITPGNYWNPLPKVRYTERPDVAAQHILEGHIVIIVDTSPSIIILPATYFHHIQHAEEYRQSPTVGVYLRWVRFAAIFVSIFLLPLWFLVSIEPSLLPPSLQYIGPDKVGKVPLIGQFVIAEGAVDVIRMAAIHTPAPLTTSLGLIAALMIGDFAVTIGLFAPEVVMYTAVAATTIFATPSYELGMAHRLARWVLLLAVYFLKIPGFFIGTLALILVTGLTKSFGVPYLWPLVPFNYTALKTILLRTPVPAQRERPSFLYPQDPTRQTAKPAPAFKPMTKGEDDDPTKREEENGGGKDEY
ncbi:MAG: spore germination protein [Desulfitobacteriaceae bacterium]|nr:spore germination protein [Desulfitobacteriaceae bacterium]